MTDALARVYILAISFTGAFLFVAVEKLEPNRRFALLLKGAILAAGGAAVEVSWYRDAGPSNFFSRLRRLLFGRKITVVGGIAATYTRNPAPKHQRRVRY